jgi:hypothetical protein
MILDNVIYIIIYNVIDNVIYITYSDNVLDISFCKKAITPCSI